MIGLLRFVGLTNAALWFGSALFFTLFAGPAFFSSDMLELFGWPKTGAAARFYAGSVAQIMLDRYYTVQCWCGGIALAHLLIERFCIRRQLQRLMLALVLGLFGLGIAGGYWLQPKLKQLHQKTYTATAQDTSQPAAQAQKAFRIWHGVSQGANLVVVLGVCVYLWRVSQPAPSPRFVGPIKFGLE